MERRSSRSKVLNALAPPRLGSRKCMYYRHFGLSPCSQRCTESSTRVRPKPAAIQGEIHVHVIVARGDLDGSLPSVPNRLICDRAADSDPLRERLATRNIELICPHRRGRKRSPTQDGRPLRRFRRRWIVERTISWLQAFRRLITRHEFYAFLYHSFAKLACTMIALRRF